MQLLSDKAGIIGNKREMKKTIIILIILALGGCVLYQTDDGLSFFKPYYMNRERQVTEQDLIILDRALELLENQEDWNKQDDRLCFYEEKWSLFCALAKASVDVIGKYNHRRVAIQETRFTINDNFRGRWVKHQLMDFNNHKLTKFSEIQWVIKETKNRLRKRYGERN